jgi:hypothetical protein
MVMTKGSAPDPRPDAGDYTAPSPRVAKINQETYQAPSRDGALPTGGPAHSAFEAMERPIKQPGKRG